MKRKILIILALALSLSMVWTGCAPKTSDTDATTAAGSSAATTTAAQPREIVTLDFMNNSESAGLQQGYWWTKILEEEIGVKINVITNTDDVTNAYIAAGNLPDIAFLRKPEVIDNAKNAGLLVNFDDYADLIPSVLASYPAGALQFQRDRFSDGGLYTLPSGANTYPVTYGTTEYYMRVDFDYFLEYVDKNGDPKLEDIEDFLPVLKGIQEAHPTNEAGLPAYGISYFASWDSTIMGYGDWFGEQYGKVYKSIAEIDMDTLTYKSVFDDGSTYKRILKFLYQANQLGILDPDSITQTWDDYTAKIADRRIYSNYCFSTNEYSKCIPYANLNTVANYIAPMYLGNANGNWCTVVSAKSSKIERACEFINFCINEDNFWRLRFGNQGEYWDVNKDGQVYVTDFGKKMDKDGTIAFKDGGNVNGITLNAWNWRPINYTVVNKKYGVTYMPASWPTVDTSNKTATQAAWENYMTKKYNMKYDGILSEIQVLNAAKAFAAERFSASSVAPSEDIKEKESRIGAITPTISWKMVYAKNEAEFNSLWADLVSQANGMGAADVVKFFGDQYVEGVESAKQYIG